MNLRDGNGLSHNSSVNLLEESMATQRAIVQEAVADLLRRGMPEDQKLSLQFSFLARDIVVAEKIRDLLNVRGYCVQCSEYALDQKLSAIYGLSPKIRMREPNVQEWTDEMCRIAFEHESEFFGWGTNPNQWA